MQFLYVFTLMFISIFGMAVLVRLIANALSVGSCKKIELYAADDDENIDKLLADLGKDPRVDRVCVILNKDSGSLERLSEKYGEIRFVGDPER